MVCDELIAKEICNFSAQSKLGQAAQFTNYRDLHLDAHQLIQCWFKCAKGRLEEPQSGRASFEGLIFAWIAFNGWASCVTGKDTDKEMIEALSFSGALRSDFDHLLSSDPSFHEVARDFHSHWPIFKAQELAERDIWVAKGTSRDERVKEYLERGAIKFSPPCWKRHRDAGEEMPLDWPHTISAIYQLRCNLFHGHKGTRSPNDHELVQRAFRVLMYFLKEGDYIIGGRQPRHQARQMQMEGL